MRSASLQRQLPYQAPLAWAALQAHHAARAIPGVEMVEPASYRRLLRTEVGGCVMEVRDQPGRAALLLTLETLDPGLAESVVARVHHVFDPLLDTRMLERELGTRDPALAPLLARHPGLRPPAGWSPFEIVVRAVLGQQVTVAHARTLAARLVKACAGSTRVPHPPPGLTHFFPKPEQVLAVDLSLLPMPEARRRTLRTVARLVIEEPRLLDSAQELQQALEAWCAIPGIGPWTAHYIALRGLRLPDAFPASDAGLLRAARSLDLAHDARALEARAQRWRPWRAHVAQHLWSAAIPGQQRA